MPALRFPIHVLVYSPAGGWKSTFASTFPKPTLVLGFDPIGKFAPYYRRGIPGPEVIGEQDQAVIQVASRKNPDVTIVQVEGFYDDLLHADGSLDPTAYLRFLSRLPSLYEEVRAGMWKTVVIDTLSAMALASKNLHQYKLHPNEKDGRKWYAQCKDDLEQAICCRLVTALRGVNFLVLAHVSKTKDEVAGIQIGEPAAPGSLASQDGLPSKFPEMYHIRGKRDKDGKIIRTLQTVPDMRFNAMSVLLNVPDDTEPTYDALWRHVEESNG